MFPIYVQGNALTLSSFWQQEGNNKRCRCRVPLSHTSWQMPKRHFCTLFGTRSLKLRSLSGPRGLSYGCVSGALVPILRKCQHCGADFKIKPFRVKTGRGKYCSRACKTEAVSGLKKKFPVEYRTYQSAKGRCRNPNHQMWRWYGERGIEFKFDSFQAFIEHISATQ